MTVYETPAATQPVEAAPLDPSKQDVVYDKLKKELQSKNRGNYVPDLGFW